MQFEWDIGKAEINLKKHNVSFVEAETVFGNPLAKIFDDEIYSIEETREIIVGHSANNRLLIICFTAKENDTVRIISARLTSAQEKKDYENAE
ncbi:MAG TPA: BrnT family toxin [Pyrinomonadaceae bacterium]|nr:BrnT family toxin [Pyrinomonadaceae bacterium]